MNNNPFEAYDIEHFSASSINTYIQEPAMWVFRYLYKNKGTGNPAMWRGTTVDEITGDALNNTKSIDILIQEGLSRYDGLYNYYLDKIDIDTKKYEKERSLLPLYVETAVNFYRELGKPISYQKKVSLQFEELPIPIIGYIDLQYEGTVRDIKTLQSLPSVIPPSVCRQLSVYAKAEDSNALVDYVYITSKKAEVVTMPVDNVDEHIAVVKKVAINIMNLLSYSNDINQIANLFYPNYDHFMWSNPLEVEEAKNIWS